MKNLWRSAFYGLLLLGTQHTRADVLGNVHFYRAQNFFGQARMARPYFSTIDITFAGGSTRESRNAQGQKTCLLNIHGPHNFHMLGAGVPDKSKTDPADLALTNLALVAGGDLFGHILYQGKFNIYETTFSYQQNLCNGFFTHIHLPIRALSIKDIQCCDLSPQDDGCPNVNTPEWQTFLNLLPAILEKYQLRVGEINRSGVGDLSLLLGWTYNYYNTELLDYIDMTFRAGLVVPTGEKSNPDDAFDLPLGHNGHLGFPMRFDVAFGTYEWLTLGGHVGALLFKDTNKILRMKTNINQNGFIKLARGKATVDRGTLWRLGAYATADHVARGFSLTLGYSFVRKKDDIINPDDCCVFSSCIVNSDDVFKGWRMHTLHIVAEYDFAKDDSHVGPRIGFFYNRELGGERVFNTHILGGSFGIDAVWDF